VIQSLNNWNKTKRKNTWEAIHRVSLIATLLPLKFPTIWNRARPDGVTWKPQISKTEYTNTQQDLPDKK
jgi:hypothetical protein